MSLFSMTHELALETSEGVVFRIPLASPFVRGIAFAIDFITIVAFTQFLQPFFYYLSAIHPDWSNGIALIAFFVIQIFYGIIFEFLWKGKTLGKALLGLQVIDARGLTLRFSQVVIRNLLRFVDGFPVAYLLGGLVAFFSPRYQRIGDLAAQTVVTRKRLHKNFSIPDWDPRRFNSLEKYPHAIARLRQQLHSDEILLAIRALLRRDSLDPQARIEIFDSIASHWKQRGGLPSDATEGISSENIVRNALELLLKKRVLISHSEKASL